MIGVPPRRRWPTLLPPGPSGHHRAMARERMVAATSVALATVAPGSRRREGVQSRSRSFTRPARAPSLPLSVHPGPGLGRPIALATHRRIHTPLADTTTGKSMPSGKTKNTNTNQRGQLYSPPGSSGCPSTAAQTKTPIPARPVTKGGNHQRHRAQVPKSKSSTKPTASGPRTTTATTSPQEFIPDT